MLLWLRGKMNIARPQAAGVLLVRRESGQASHRRQIAAGPEFLDLLARYGFETVDFGSGEHTIEQQVEMLSGAEVVLAPHGAGLTNLTYLNAPLTLIEVFSGSLFRRTMTCG